jgi:hydrogenase nickel incorporation protein HypA/HybF
MHELAIADAIVAIAGKHAAGRRVLAVDVKVGALRQVVPDALEFAFELSVQGSRLEGAELRIESVRARGRCFGCGATSELGEFPFACADCGSADLELMGGEELLVESIEVDDELVTTGRKDDGYCDD